MGYFIFLLGFLGWIGSLVFFIINLIKKKPKKRALVSSGICFIVLIMGLFLTPVKDVSNEAAKTDNKTVEKSPSKTEKEATNKTKKVTTADEKNKGTDTKNTYKNVINEESSKDIYLNNVKPWYKNVVEKYDNSWKTYWSGTWNQIAEGSTDNANAKKKFDQLVTVENEEVRKFLSSFKVPTNLKKDEKEDVESFRKNMLLAVEMRHNATLEAILFLEGKTQLDMEGIQATIGRGDKYMLSGVASMVSLEHKLGLIDQSEN